MFNTVECPYCEHDNDMSEGCVDLPDSLKFDHECENCEQEFEVEVEFQPTYGGSKIEYDNCERCEKETRDAVILGKRFPYPKEYKGNVLCETCWGTEMHIEYVKEKNGN